eukprot:CAMPEP_0202703972 /NCGR_PEP_ID=MMETSP1385-20130828/16739_1 /ASSEMBLY_ACC=CAM_ASM_000861 /TAXON_ID=933848 /ORGANISM="Elphidium margaritaceum" /LENGTH=175 /DNA_ID=CAMNT_0049361903 /DNA_START=175 /DNA_END=698 /DNA_ORIENTATION=-
MTLFVRCFEIAREWRLTDYIHMKQLPFHSIAKRPSYNLPAVVMPAFVHVHIGENDQYSKDWCDAVLAAQQLRAANALLGMSDGSAKRGVGGCGAAIIGLAEYRVWYDWTAMCESNFAIRNQYDMCTHAESIGFRVSIEHGELRGAIELVRRLPYMIRDCTRIIFIGIDSESVRLS